MEILNQVQDDVFIVQGDLFAVQDDALCRLDHSEPN